MSENNKKLKSLPTIKKWIMAIRPKTLSASVSPIILTYALVWHFAEHSPSKSITLTTLFCALLMQAGTNLVNDYFDGVKGIDDENRLGPIRVVSSGLIPARRVQFGYQICFLAAFLLGTYLMAIGGTSIIIIGILSLIFAYAYTGGPWPLSHYALGEVLAFIFFGPIAMIGTAILLNFNNLKLILLFSIPMGLWSSSLMSLNNLRDIQSDSKTSKRTIATILGEKKARIFTLLLIFSPTLILIALILKFKISYFHLLSLICYIPLINHFPKILKAPITKDLNETLANIGKALTIYSLVNSVLFVLF